MRGISLFLLLLMPVFVQASELQKRYNDCMLEHLEKARTDRAVVVLSEICQHRSQLGDSLKVPEQRDWEAEKARYCELMGLDYISETGRCAE